MSLFAYSSIDGSGGTGEGALNSRNPASLNPMLLDLNFQNNHNFHSYLDQKPNKYQYF